MFLTLTDATTDRKIIIRSDLIYLAYEVKLGDGTLVTKLEFNNEHYEFVKESIDVLADYLNSDSRLVD